MHEMKYSGIEWIGEIPKDWKLKRIQFCLNEINEKNIPIKTRQVLSLVKDKGVMLYEDKGNQGNKAKEDISQYKIAYPNTLIINSMNILIGSVGISNYLGCVSPVYYVFKENEYSDLRYINYIFNTREFQKELRKYANGILEIRLRVSSYDIFKRKIPLPNKNTQEKIADFLDIKCNEIDVLYAEIEKQIETLEEYKKTIITHAVTKGLNSNIEMKDSGVEWLGKIPKNWNVTRIGYESWIRARLGWKGLKAEEYVLDGHPFLSAYNIIQNKISWDQLNYITDERYFESPEIMLKKGDIVLVKDGAGIGKCAKIDNLPYGTATTNGSLAVITPTFGKLDYNYLYFYLQSAMFQNYILRIMNGMGVPHLSQEELRKIKIPFPPIDEQIEIAKYLEKKQSDIDMAILEKIKQLDALKQYKRSFIFEYVTGKNEV